MKKSLFWIMFLALVPVFGGCAARSGGGGRFSNFSLTPPLLTVVLINNVSVPIEVLENGELVGGKDQNGKWQPFVVMPGGVVSRGYYNFIGSRQLVITVRGICPNQATQLSKGSAGCTPGQYLGTASRSFYIHTNGQRYSEEWEVNYLRRPQGVQ